MKDLNKKRIGLYARVSTEMQTDGYSIQGQLNHLKDYCQFQGYEVVDEYTIVVYPVKPPNVLNYNVC